MLVFRQLFDPVSSTHLRMDDIANLRDPFALLEEVRLKME